LSKPQKDSLTLKQAIKIAKKAGYYKRGWGKMAIGDDETYQLDCRKSRMDKTKGKFVFNYQYYITINIKTGAISYKMKEESRRVKNSDKTIFKTVTDDYGNPGKHVHTEVIEYRYDGGALEKIYRMEIVENIKSK
jgi:hypothetical protein